MLRRKPWVISRTSRTRKVNLLRNPCRNPHYQIFLWTMTTDPRWPLELLLAHMRQALIHQITITNLRKPLIILLCQHITRTLPILPLARHPTTLRLVTKNSTHTHLRGPMTKTTRSLLGWLNLQLLLHAIPWIGRLVHIMPNLSTVTILSMYFKDVLHTRLHHQCRSSNRISVACLLQRSKAECRAPVAKDWPMIPIQEETEDMMRRLRMVIIEGRMPHRVFFHSFVLFTIFIIVTYYTSLCLLALETLEIQCTTSLIKNDFLSKNLIT